MSTTTATLNINATQALQALDKVNKQVQGLGNSFGKLQNLIGGVAIGAFIRNAFMMADAIDDISKATGIATANVMGFGQAVAANGGTIEGANQALTKFVTTIGEAKDGNKNAITSFNEVGVSLKDLATLSEQDLLAKVVKGLSEITDKSKQARLSLELTGKSLKGVDVSGLAQDYQKATAAAAKYAESNKSAADANQNLQVIQTKLTNELLLTLKPISDMVKSIDANSESFMRWYNAIKNVVIAIGSLFLIGRVIRLVSGLVTSVRALIAALNEMFSLRMGVGEFFKNWFKWNKKVKDALETTAKEMKRQAENPENFYGKPGDLEKQYTRITKIGEAIQLLKGYALQAGAAIVTVGAGLFGYFQDVEPKKPERKRTAGRPGGGRGTPDTTADSENLERLNQAYAEGKLKVDDYTDSLQKEFKQIAENFTVQREALQIGEKLAQVKEVERQVTEKAADARKRYEEMKQGLDPKNENDRKLISYINEQIRLLGLKEKAALAAGKTAVDELQKEQEAYIQLNRALDEYRRKLESEENLQNMRDEIELIGLTGQELQKTTEQFKIYADLRKKLNDLQAEENDLTAKYNSLTEEGRAKEKQAFENSLADINKRRQEASQGAADEIKINEDKWKKIGEVAQDGLKGFQDKLKEMKEQLTPYSLGEGLANALGEAVDTFVKTGKFKFKEFAANALKEWAAMKAKLAMINLFEGVFNQLKNLVAQKIGGMIIGKLLGFAEGGNPPVNKPSIVGEKGPELFVPKTAGTIIPNDQLGKGKSMGTNSVSAPVTNNYITNNISALDAKSVAQLFAENRKAIFGANKMAEREMSYAGAR